MICSRTSEQTAVVSHVCHCVVVTPNKTGTGLPSSLYLLWYLIVGIEAER